MKTVLLIIDVQREFFEEGRLKENKDKLVANINKLADAAHNKNIPVIWIRQKFKADLSDAPLYNRKHHKLSTIEGTPGAEFLPELHKNKNDYEIVKKRYSSFFNTNLEELLKKLKVDTVIIAGINTMTCVRVTAIDAYQRDYEVILALDCVDAYDLEQHENSVKYLQYAVAKGMKNAKIIEVIKSIL
ncbi:MAG: cysteine hydrolase [Parcubacteria group bacterium]|jgi:nicotinamidase-related amidase